jgi:hypothetical protein
MLEDFGVINVNDNHQAAPVVMSRSDNTPAQSPRPSLETGNQTDGQTDMQPRIRAEQLLTVYKLMRAAGIGREDAAAAFKAAGLPFNNNVWRDAEPKSEHVTPIVGRPTSARFDITDPDYPYQAPA